ncbi:MAG: hypothetical protein ABR589_04930 [Chthoniobacterales bacterium]
MQPRLLSYRNAIIGFALAVTVIIFPLSNLSAHEGHDHGTPAAAVPAGNPWQAAQGCIKAIEAAATAKDHKPIHDEQEKLVAALKQLQAQSAGAPDKTRLDGAIKNAITASEKVHAAADAKDFAKVGSSLKTLQATMSQVEKQLPAGTK